MHIYFIISDPAMSECMVFGCHAKKSKKTDVVKVKFHTFPNPLKCRERFLKWVSLCGNKELLRLDPINVSQRRICGKHFKLPNAHMVRLPKDMIPTLHLPEPLTMDENWFLMNTLAENNCTVTVPTSFNTFDISYTNADMIMSSTERCCTPRHQLSEPALHTKVSNIDSLQVQKKLKFNEELPMDFASIFVNFCESSLEGHAHSNISDEIPNGTLALISVSDRTGLLELGKELCGLGLTLVSSGDDGACLREAGLSVEDISYITGAAPELLNGQLDVLHPAVQAGILSRLTDSDRSDTEVQQYDMIRVVVCNLPRFPAVTVDNIDVGRPSVLRSAAKNHDRVTVICDPRDYAEVIREMKTSAARDTTLATRRKLAMKALRHICQYDIAIAEYFEKLYGGEQR